jgi:hypothetical protein
MKNKFLLNLFVVICSGIFHLSFAQEKEEINYFQMEPLDDSLFVKIQTEVFIDPADPKAEIIADLRDANNQTVSIKGTLYPYLAFTPETRARIQTYPFKINLEEDIHYGSVFSRVFEKIRISKILGTPSLFQISPTLHYVNPFLQLFGGERFGMPLKKDVGLSFGLGTPYTGPMETNMIESNFHILGFSGGVFTYVDALTLIKKTNLHNNIYVLAGYQLAYVIPFGNFLEVGFQSSLSDISQELKDEWMAYSDTAHGYQVKIIDGEYFKWEFRYPLSFLGSTRAKVYVGQYFGEWHAGFTGRELSLAGSTFDFRFDAMFESDVRQPQYVIDILVQKIFENWAFSAFALGPSAILSKTDKGKFGFISILLNARFKLGTSL